MLLILRVRRKIVWTTGVVNIMCQEKDGLGYCVCCLFFSPTMYIMTTRPNREGKPDMTSESSRLWV